jgi:hypothetical protein
MIFKEFMIAMSTCLVVGKLPIEISYEMRSKIFSREGEIYLIDNVFHLFSSYRQSNEKADLKRGNNKRYKPTTAFPRFQVKPLVRAIESEGDISPAGLADVCRDQFVGVAYLK